MLNKENLFRIAIDQFRYIKIQPIKQHETPGNNCRVGVIPRSLVLRSITVFGLNFNISKLVYCDISVDVPSPSKRLIHDSQLWVGWVQHIVNNLGCRCPSMSHGALY